MLLVLNMLSLKCVVDISDVQQITQKRGQNWGSLLGVGSFVEIIAVEEVSKGGPTCLTFRAGPRRGKGMYVVP